MCASILLYFLYSIYSNYSEDNPNTYDREITVTYTSVWITFFLPQLHNFYYYCNYYYYYYYYPTTQDLLSS